MKNPSIIKWAAVVIIVAAASCAQESLELEPVTNTMPMNLDTHRSAHPGLRLDCSNQPDLIIQSITDRFSLFQPFETRFPFVVTIKNIGEAVATIKGLNRVWWQAWQSKDGVTRDRAVCFFTTTPIYFNLDVNQTMTDEKQFCTLKDLVNYPYLIVDLDMNDDSVDCNKSNNTYVMQLLAVSSLP